MANGEVEVEGGMRKAKAAKAAKAMGWRDECAVELVMR
jgi:hypothetical protein